ncbi:Lsa family ABC-F type ribosomal protection protein [Clostridia bacterium]|nr:Lsa family ABC-F type ribosomal protection protein [Clostridia bacterium]
MSQISVSNLTFAYDEGRVNIFENVSFTIDTDWRLGFCGRNGRGKTTFLKLLCGELEYKGTISSTVRFSYFPFETDSRTTVAAFAERVAAGHELWEFQRELNLLDTDGGVLDRPFQDLSEGERVKVSLAALFLRDNHFLLIDEPTNHLDGESRRAVGAYLNKKKGFILVSHDRTLLDGCTDHILSINKTNIEIQKGNFSSWLTNKERKDNFEKAQNKKLAGEIDKLKAAARRKSGWSDSAERGKYRLGESSDRGYIGSKAAKVMKTAKAIEKRRDAAAEEKARLLKNIERADALEMFPAPYRAKRLISARDLALARGGREIVSGLNFTISEGDRIHLRGKNGSGKSSLIQILRGEMDGGKAVGYNGALEIGANLKISYVPQDTSALRGSLQEFAREHALDDALFRVILMHLDFDKTLFDMDIYGYSAGQKKKVYLAKSLSESAHLYIWDEPLNYIDVFSRMQIEELILRYKPTILFVEHDRTFAERIATGAIDLS